MVFVVLEVFKHFNYAWMIDLLENIQLFKQLVFFALVQSRFRNHLHRSFYQSSLVFHQAHCSESTLTNHFANSVAIQNVLGADSHHVFLHFKRIASTILTAYFRLKQCYSRNATCNSNTLSQSLLRYTRMHLLKSK